MERELTRKRERVEDARKRERVEDARKRERVEDARQQERVADAADEHLIRALRSDYRQADLTPRERAMLDYAFRLTVAPNAVQEGCVQALRAAGFDDRAIVQLNLLTAFFNYVNRVADGLGVARGPEAPRAAP